eukprot:jgi/Picsp_1/6286/NSC_03636-R1_tetratricopeptide repeat-containing protein
MPPKAQDSQVLPAKEQALFRQLVKQYETKLYKKGLKTADLILKKFPDNGETLAMKGLLCNCLNRKEEAYDLVKQGVKSNLRSHVCWHVYGLLYRSDREYDEAIKCYKNSLRMEKDNLTVLRDLAQLQIQIRDLGGFLETRQRLLELKPTNRQTWILLALAHHLLGNYELAATVLDSYETTLDSVIISSEPYEHSEILMYKINILREGGKFNEALQALDTAEKAGYIKDKLGAIEMRALLLKSIGGFDEAAALYSKLICINPDNYEYHIALIECQNAKHGKEKDPKEMLQYYTELAKKYPDSIACRRIPLDFLEEYAFEQALNEFIKPYIEDGIPSLFSELKPLYSDAEKVAIIERVLCDYKVSGEDKAWVTLYLALHFSLLGNIEKALEYIQSCMDAKPDLIEAYSAKSTILDAAGDYLGAALAAEQARKMDLADRYLNCQSSMALFKAGMAEKAELVAHLFTKEGDQANNFYDMQATWYEISSGNYYLLFKDYGRALKRFRKVDSHYSDFVEDQFDFHGYCARKQTMRAYVDMLRMLDNLYSSEVYGQAVRGAVTIYVDLHDNPPKSKEQILEERLASLSVEDAKRERQKLRKLEAKKQKELSQAADEANKGNKEKGKRVDDDPHGERLLQTPEPLTEASRLMKLLIRGNANTHENQILAYQVDIRRDKPFLALKDLQKAIDLAGKDHPAVHECIIDMNTRAQNPGFSSSFSKFKDQTSILEKIVLDTCQGFMQNKNIQDYHAAWKQANRNKDIMSGFISAKIDMLMEASGVNPEAKFKVFLDDVRSLLQSTVVSHKECESVYESMKDLFGEQNEITKSYKELCAKSFEYSRTFGGSSCIDLDSLQQDV